MHDIYKKKGPNIDPVVKDAAALEAVAGLASPRSYKCLGLAFPLVARAARAVPEVLEVPEVPAVQASPSAPGFQGVH